MTHGGRRRATARDAALGGRSHGVAAQRAAWRAAQHAMWRAAQHAAWRRAIAEAQVARAHKGLRKNAGGRRQGEGLYDGPWTLERGRGGEMRTSARRAKAKHQGRPGRRLAMSRLLPARLHRRDVYGRPPRAEVPYAQKCRVGAAPSSTRLGAGEALSVHAAPAAHGRPSAAATAALAILLRETYMRPTPPRAPGRAWLRRRWQPPWPWCRPWCRRPWPAARSAPTWAAWPTRGPARGRRR